MDIRTNGARLLRLGITVVGLFLASASLAQNPPATPPPDTTQSPPAAEGKDIGGYHVTQSIELGGRISEVNGSQAMYDTLVNYQTGARILEQSLTMQSLSHQDIFDTLTVSSFGWGGDPEQAARMRVAKYGWYNFSASYQHMQNYFDYNLLANPLNPSAGANPYIPFLPRRTATTIGRIYTTTISSYCRCTASRGVSSIGLFQVGNEVPPISSMPNLGLSNLALPRIQSRVLGQIGNLRRKRNPSSAGFDDFHDVQ